MENNFFIKKYIFIFCKKTNVKKSFPTKIFFFVKLFFEKKFA